MPDTSTTQNQVSALRHAAVYRLYQHQLPDRLVLYWVVMNIMQIGQQLLWKEDKRSKGDFNDGFY